MTDRELLQAIYGRVARMSDVMEDGTPIAPELLPKSLMTWISPTFYGSTMSQGLYVKIELDSVKANIMLCDAIGAPLRRVNWRLS